MSHSLSAPSSDLLSLTSLPPSVLSLHLTFPTSNNATATHITYKQLAEAFVSNHSGSSMVSLVVLLVSVALWFWIWVCLILIKEEWTRRKRRREEKKDSATTASPTSSSFASSPSASSFASTNNTTNTSFSSLLPSFLFDYFLLIFPVLCTFTIFSQWTEIILILQILAIGLLVCIYRLLFSVWCVRCPSLLSSSSTADDLHLLSHLNSLSKSFLTNYRVSLQIGTAISILAVDFVIYPRAYCKTESFGISLMDAGVGSFIISHALTSQQVRKFAKMQMFQMQETNNESKLHDTPHQRTTLLHDLLHILRSMFPLLLLGILRLFTIRSVDYQVHLSEYGVHWNFFFTLAMIALIGEVTNRALGKNANKLIGVLGVLLLLSYELLLHSGLSNYILHSPRTTNFISANKEGIFSSIGYGAMYMMSVRLGMEVMKGERSVKEWERKVVKLGALTSFLFFLTYLSSTYISASSRRMVNMTYVLWMLSMNLLLVLVFLVREMVLVVEPTEGEKKRGTAGARRGGESWNATSGEEEAHILIAGKSLRNVAFSPSSSPSASPRSSSASTASTSSSSSLIVSAINKNSLAYFLLCNICTGAVNLSMHTILASNVTAMLVLSVYSFVTCLAFVYVDYHGWRIKL